MTRRHLQLVAVNDSSVNKGSSNGEQPQTGLQSARPQSGRCRGSSAINSFEHRHHAQQQLLEQQQRQLKEQRRLIEEMQALQRQQMLQQQLASAQQHKSERSGGQFEPSHLHTALASIQQDVLQEANEHLNTDCTAKQVTR